MPHQANLWRRLWIQLKSAEKAEVRTKQVDQEARAMAGEAEQPVPTMAEPVAAEKLVSVTEKSVETATDPAEKTIEKAGTGTQAASPAEIILEASNGNITFTHGAHAEIVACSTCHGEGTPTAFGIDKDIAHKLCKGCHKDGGAGPTGCRECHINNRLHSTAGAFQSKCCRLTSDD